MEKPNKFIKKTIAFLQDSPLVNDKNGREGLLIDAGLDLELLQLISLEGPTSVFFQKLIHVFIQYGQINDGRHAIEALLEATKNRVGQDKKQYCDALLIEWREYQQKKERLDTSEETNDIISKYPYLSFLSTFREVIAPKLYPLTGAFLHIVFGNIADVQHTVVVIPVGESYDFWQRGPRSILRAFEKLHIGNDLFFDALEYLWPEEQRPQCAGLGDTHYVSLPSNSRFLRGIICTVTTRNLSQQPVHYGQYVTTPIEGIEHVIDNVLQTADNANLETLALPLLGTGYANIDRIMTNPESKHSLKKVVLCLTIQKIEEQLMNPHSAIRRGIIVIHSPAQYSKEEHDIWNCTIKFLKSDCERRKRYIDELLQVL